LIEVPQKSVGGKNSADIRLVVDAMDMSFQKEHINCFVVASGDSDFSPLVSKLKENNKYVIGLGVKNSTSDLLIENCDEFIFYEDLVRGQARPLPQIGNLPEKVQECFGLLVDSVLALQRENKEVLWGSMVKETMKRKKPSFNETYYGFRTFSHLLEEAQRKNIVTLRRDQKSGSYIVEDLGAGSGAAAASSSSSPSAAASASGPRLVETPQPVSASAAAVPGEAPAAEAASANGRPRRRRGRGRRSRTGVAATGAYAEGASSATDEGPEDEHDEGDFDLGGSDEGHDAEGPASESPAAGGTAASGAPPHEAPPAASGSAESQSAFSLFSWLRRDAPREPEPPPPEPERKED
jgi:hypothetical protein